MTNEQRTMMRQFVDKASRLEAELRALRAEVRKLRRDLAGAVREREEARKVAAHFQGRLLLERVNRLPQREEAA